MEITKETVRINKVICEKKETINVQGDMIVPDSKPDILNTINTTGNICIQCLGCRIGDGHFFLGDKAITGIPEIQFPDTIDVGVGIHMDGAKIPYAFIGRDIRIDSGSGGSADDEA